MDTFITAITPLFTFMWTQIGAAGTFLITNIIGQIILAVIFLGIIVDLIIYFIRSLVFRG